MYHLRQALRKADGPRIEKALKEVSQAMHDMRSSLFGFRCMYSENITAVTAEARASGAKEEESEKTRRMHDDLRTLV